jgi:hypothetical protein
MQSAKCYWVVFVVLCIGVAAAFAGQPLPQPEFTQIDWLRVDGIQKMTVEKAIEITKKHASVFTAPFDALELHAEIDGQVKDIFIISDLAQRRLTIWQFTSPDNNGHRDLEKVIPYYGEKDDSLSAPSGLETNARNRLFIGGQDLIYLADRGNGRIIEYTYFPDSDGGKLLVNRKFGKGQLGYPMDISISAYGNTNPYTCDFFVVDAGTFNDDGALFRFNFDGQLTGSWHDLNFLNSEKSACDLLLPVSVACYPDTAENTTVIYITEAINNSLINLQAENDRVPAFIGIHSLEKGLSYWQAGGVAVDDFGRIYVANSSLGMIEIYGPDFWPRYQPYGKLGIEEGQLNYPVNIIIDTYNKDAEALVFECYDRFSGIQSFTISQASSDIKPAIGFISQGLPKINAGSGSAVPNAFVLGDAYPNPFNSNCLIEFAVNRQTDVAIEMFNILGQSVGTIYKGMAAPGVHKVKFDGNRLSSGIYFYRMTAPGYFETKRILMLK